jgi:hypothetical protein
MNKRIPIPAIIVVTFMSAMCALASATVPSDGEFRMDFKSRDDVKNARIAAHKDINIQHHSEGRAGDGSLMAVNKSTSAQYLSVRCDDFCGEGEGVLLSMWVRMENHPDLKTRCALSLKCSPKGKKDKYISLSSVPLAQEGWTLLSGWYYRGPMAGNPLEFKVAVEPGVTLLIDDMVLIRSSIAQPMDKRLPLLVKGAHVFEGETRFLLHGVNLYGSSDNEKDDTHHVTSSVTEDDYRDIATAGFNCVRLCLWHKVFRENGGWEWLKLHCLWARRHGLRLILDMHSPPGGYQSNEYKGEFWKNPKMQQELIDFWVEAAKVFKDHPVVAAFDIMNEPKPPKDKDWISFASRTLVEIRKAGWNRPVIVESSMLVDGWSELSPKLDDPGVIYDVHFYMPWDFCSKGEPAYGQAGRGYGGAIINAAFLREHLELDLLRFSRKHHVPVNSGEFGVSEKALAAGGEKWLADMFSLMNENGVSRQYFCWCVYGDFAIEPGWFRQSPPERRVNVLNILKDASSKQKANQAPEDTARKRADPQH